MTRMLVLLGLNDVTLSIILKFSIFTLCFAFQIESNEYNNHYFININQL